MIFRRYEDFEPEEIWTFYRMVSADGKLTYSALRVLVLLTYELRIFSARGMDRRKMAKELGLSERQISRGLDELQGKGIIRRSANGNEMTISLYGYLNGTDNEDS